MKRDPDRRGRPRYEPDSGDEPGSLPSWLWYLAPTPVLLVVMAMILFDGFLIVGIAVLVVLGIAAFAWHELGEW
jgi:hypothetical protein